jgi:hypothetical protein
MGVNSLGPKKIARIARETGLDVVRVWAAGGSDHTLLLLLRDGSAFDLSKDGTLTPVDPANVPR